MTVEQDVTQQTKTEQLKEWLDAEIKRHERDEWILENALDSFSCFIASPTALSRYWGLTSDELVAKKEKDADTLKQIKKDLELLRSAQAFKFTDTIEDLERVFRAPFVLEFQGAYNFSPPIIKFSKVVADNLRIAVEISLAMRVVVIRHEALQKEHVRAFSKVCYSNLTHFIISKYPEILLFLFEENGKRHYLTFDTGRIDCCFLSS